MTLEAFFEIIDNDIYKRDFIVRIRQKYKHETEWEEMNELLLFEDGQYIWLYDWNEGQEDIIVLWYIAVEDVNMAENVSKGCVIIHDENYS